MQPGKLSASSSGEPGELGERKKRRSHDGSGSFGERRGVFHKEDCKTGRRKPSLRKECTVGKEPEDAVEALRELGYRATSNGNSRR